MYACVAVGHDEQPAIAQSRAHVVAPAARHGLGQAEYRGYAAQQKGGEHGTLHRRLVAAHHAVALLRQAEHPLAYEVFQPVGRLPGAQEGRFLPLHQRLVTEF